VFPSILTPPRLVPVSSRLQLRNAQPHLLAPTPHDNHNSPFVRLRGSLLCHPLARASDRGYFKLTFKDGS